MPEFVATQKDGHLLVVTMDRPDVMNSLHPPANKELEDVFNDFAADPDLWVAIITGAGDRAFSAGNDLKYQAMGGKMFRVDSGFAGLTNRFDLDKPVIAAVNGVAMGGGFEIALACDLIIADEKAIFALPEPKVGLAALAGGLHRLPRQIGEKRAMGMILTARRVSAQEGKELGFVNDVAPAGQSLDVAKKWAGDILECGPLSIRASKQAVMKGLAAPSVRDALADQMQYPAIQTLFQSEDFKEGPMAFAQKRKPAWQGK